MKARIRSIAIPMAVGFIVTLAMMWHQIVGHLPMSDLSQGMASIKRSVLAETHSVNPGAMQAVPRDSAGAVSGPESEAEVPPSDSNGPPLPLLFNVSAHTSIGRLVVGQPPRREVQRQVDVINQSDEPLDLAILETGATPAEAGQVRLMVPPRQQAHVGTEAGLKLEPGDQVTLRSKGYQEMTTTVD